ncbi:cyclin-dependent protein kinase inhibitor SMR6-like [Cynara cardunculus var. scolymus]|uniref:Cyclin-dependent kinase inhibitor n=1 Tax=Cynara cardunculus var. scolymus TaxID=59895 RepID=A0A103XL54_CYNCS|nr:cyclin-dependent protein kinase inhibitor SMR6-like [Cynara cardunculus var. scolymus]KVH92796.1 hypothetical protein Ccrd_005144 [Cynara cardunculus var. scolymus]
MGFSKKHQADSESMEGKKWMIAGITLRAPLKPISTKISNEEDDETSNSGSTTPTSNQSRIPEVLPCPPPPRKRRPVSTCHNNGNREFFTSPDIDSFFKIFPNTGKAN